MTIDFRFHFCLIMTAVNLLASWLVTSSQLLAPTVTIFAFSAVAFGLAALTYFFMPIDANDEEEGL